MWHMHSVCRLAMWLLLAHVAITTAAEEQAVSILEPESITPLHEHVPAAKQVAARLGGGMGAGMGFGGMGGGLSTMGSFSMGAGGGFEEDELGEAGLNSKDALKLYKMIEIHAPEVIGDRPDAKATLIEALQNDIKRARLGEADPAEREIENCLVSNKWSSEKEAAKMSPKSRRNRVIYGLSKLKKHGDVKKLKKKSDAELATLCEPPEDPVAKAKLATKQAAKGAEGKDPTGPDFEHGLWKWAKVYNSIFSSKCDVSRMTRPVSSTNNRALLCTDMKKTFWTMKAEPKAARIKKGLKYPWWGCCNKDSPNCKQTMAPDECPLKDKKGNCENGNLCFVGTWKTKDGGRQLDLSTHKTMTMTTGTTFKICAKKGGSHIPDDKAEYVMLPGALAGKNDCKKNGEIIIDKLDLVMDLRKLVVCQTYKTGKKKKYTSLLSGKSMMVDVYADKCAVTKHGKVEKFYIRSIRGIKGKMKLFGVETKDGDQKGKNGPYKKLTAEMLKQQYAAYIAKSVVKRYFAWVTATL
jgi:hypothetical protein